MRPTLVFAAIVLAGCAAPSPLDVVAREPAAPSWGPDCSIAKDDATPCVARLDPDDGNDLEVSLAAHPDDPDTILLAWTSRLGSRAEIWTAITQDAGKHWTLAKMQNPHLGPDPQRSTRWSRSRPKATPTSSMAARPDASDPRLNRWNG